MKLPHGHSASVPRKKVSEYLLLPEHPEGGSRARFFLGLGYSPGRPDVLVKALVGVARHGDVRETIESSYGTKYVIDGLVKAPDGRRVLLRTVWIRRTAEAWFDFVTAYPRSVKEK